MENKHQLLLVLWILLSKRVATAVRAAHWLSCLGFKPTAVSVEIIDANRTYSAAEQEHPRRPTASEYWQARITGTCTAPPAAPRPARRSSVITPSRRSRNAEPPAPAGACQNPASASWMHMSLPMNRFHYQKYNRSRARMNTTLMAACSPRFSALPAETVVIKILSQLTSLQSKKKKL
jgi:hypothetical protein